MSPVKRLTKKQAVIVSAYTGFICCDFNEVHAEIERRLRRPVMTHQMMPDFWEREIRPYFKADFVSLAPAAKSE